MDIWDIVDIIEEIFSFLDVNEYYRLRVLSRKIDQIICNSKNKRMTWISGGDRINRLAHIDSLEFGVNMFVNPFFPEKGHSKIVSLGVYTVSILDEINIIPQFCNLNTLCILGSDVVFDGFELLTRITDLDISWNHMITHNSVCLLTGIVRLGIIYAWGIGELCVTNFDCLKEISLDSRSYESFGNLGDDIDVHIFEY